MNLRTIVFSVALLGAGTFLGSQVFSQEKHDGHEHGDGMDQAEAMKRWMEVMTPSDIHKEMAKAEGAWGVTCKWWMAPGAPPTESKANCKMKMALGGRFLMQEFEGEMMGMPFQGIGYTGYDNFKKKYVSVWMDSFGTAITTSEGTADATGKVITFEGVMDEPMTGEKNKKFRHILRHVDDDTTMFEMHDLALEKMGMSTKVAEMTYKRKRPASKS